MIEQQPRPDSVKQTSDFLQWAERTTIEGVPNLVSSTGVFTRVFWVAVLIMMSGLFLIHFIFSLQGFIASGISSKLSMEANTSQFPDVTVCGLKPVSDSLVSYYEGVVNQHLQSHWDYFDNWFRNERRRLRGEGNSDFFLRVKEVFFQMLEIFWLSDDVRDLSFSNVFSILGCTFNGQQCGANNLTLLANFRYWNCYTFSPEADSVMPSYLSDPEAGLSLSIYTDDSYFPSAFEKATRNPPSYTSKELSLREYLTRSPGEFPINSLLAGDYSSDGVKVILHLSNSYPFYFETQLYRTHVVQNGMSATFHVATVKRARQNTSKFTCSGDIGRLTYVSSFAFEPDSIQTKEFTRTAHDLYSERAQAEVYHLCGCYSHRLPFNANKSELCYYVLPQHRKAPTAEAESRIRCLNSWSSKMGDDLDKFSLESDQLCERIYREVQVDVSDWPNEEDLVPVVNFYSNIETKEEDLGKDGHILNFSDPEFRKAIPAGQNAAIPRNLLMTLSLLDPDCKANLTNASYMDINFARAKTISCLNRERARSNLLRINVRLASLGSTTYEEVNTYELVEILSEVGGILGLWFGISTLTLFELAEILIIICLRKRPNAAQEAQRELEDSESDHRYQAPDFEEKYLPEQHESEKHDPEKHDPEKHDPEKHDPGKHDPGKHEFVVSLPGGLPDSLVAALSRSGYTVNRTSSLEESPQVHS